ncbi:voltage-dependent T-type calcium channel subunit alpha-1I isoform X2 [Symphalangus syndactylus]|uniref:voltage-dependent T-type calcium channel subunit alpha-1I isoform X2 n=1 Tax=Symphalangus syndactylus TaxID=9590 RepID=UPI0030049F49
MAESASPPSSSAAAPAAEPGVTTEQPGPRSPPSSPPGLEEPLDGADPHVPHPDLAPVAFFCLRQTTSPRNWCIKMVCNPWFECVSMLVILLNCVTLGMYQPCDDMDCLSDRCKILQVFDDFIFIFFAMEMVLKMVALGIFGKKCYLGDTWNRLDFFIVMAGMVEYSLDLQNINLSAIRTVRVLRPLKAINRVPSMRILVNLLLDTLPMLGNVLLLCFFVFFIFGIIGVQLWAGLLRNRCFLEENFTIQGDVALPPYYQPEEDDEMPFICSLSGDNGIMGCHEIPPLKEQGRECCLSKDDVYDFGAGRQDLNASGLCVNWNRYYNVCRTGSANPHKGAINFDNIGYAWIVIFQVITLEGWVEIMYYVMDAHSFYNFIYFILLIIVGSFFMINLCLVVIATQFSETKQREHRLMLEQRQRYLSSSTVASYAEPGDCYEEIFQYVCHILRKAKRRALGLYQALQSRRQALGPEAPAPAKPGPHAKEPRHYNGKTKGQGVEGRHLGSRHCQTLQGPAYPGNDHSLGKRHARATGGGPCSQPQYHFSQLVPRRKSAGMGTALEQPRPSAGLSPACKVRTGDPSMWPSAAGVSHPRPCSGKLHPFSSRSLGIDSWEASRRMRAQSCRPPVLGCQPSRRGLGGGPRWPVGRPGTRTQELGPGKAGTGVAGGRGGEVFTPMGFLWPPSPLSWHPCPLAPGPPLCPGKQLAAAPCPELCPQHSPLDVTAHTLVQPIPAMLASDPASCPCCQHEAGRRPSGLGSTDSGQEGSGSGSSTGGEDEADGDEARSSEDRASSELGKEEEEEEQADGTVWLCGDVWRETRAKLRGIVDSKYFNRGIMMAILVNTVSMGIEHHEQPEELTNILEICNVVFTSMFALEMILKLAAFGLFDYLRNPYNIFDSIIVIISIWEIVGQADGGLSVLRTFRLLRVLKLVRFMPALRRQLVVLMKTMDNVATFCMLLMLFIFIFSILGMHIFGCKFSLRTDTGDTVPDRKNFDSLLWAIVTVFQILTQEDWNVVLYNGMASTSPWASLYFVALMTFGNYVLFNLLVAILVEGFQAEGDANRSYTDEDQSSSNMEEFDKLQEGLDSSGDPKLCPIPMTPNGHLDPSLPLGGHLGPAGAAGPAPRLSLQPDPMLVALGSRKSSVMSLGRMSYDQRSLSSSRSSYYGPWGRSAAWASRRSSWNSLKHKPPSAEHESLLSAERGGGARVCEVAADEGPPRAAPLHAPHTHHTHHGPHLAHRHRHHRRTLSLDNRDSVDLAELVPAVGAHPRAAWRAAGPVPGHEDCNGRMPSIAKDVFTKMGDRGDRGEDEEEIDYTLCFRVRKMIDVYKPDWCEVREDWSVYLFSPENRFRVLCQTIIAHKLFDYVVLAFIFLNCITIALERPQIEAGSTERIFLTVSNYIFTAIFVGEMTLKVVSLGLYFGEQAYLRSSWNVLDGFLVFVSIIDIVVSLASAGGAKILGVLRVLRLLRTLRPLRVISRAPGLKLVVETLISSLKPIGNIVLICCAFFIIFGILGVQLFKGKFYHCLGVDTRNITNRSDCMAANYRWVHHKYNFDNLGQALMSLFVLASKDGWVNIMYNGLDAVAVDQQPVTNHNPWMLLYFISFLLIVSFFVLNMFVGVVVENFHKCRQHQEAEEARRREEKRLRRLEKKRRKAQRLPYYATYCHTRLLIHSMCTSHYLDIFITFIICLNVVTMSLEHYNQPTSLETALKYCNYMFTTVFVLEAVLKLVAFGLRRFFKDRWNQLDLAIVLLSVMGITLEEIEINAALPINPTIIRIMRVLRIARVLKLLKMATGMRALLDTVVQALPQVGNLGLLFMLLFFIYAALGVELFGKLVCNDENPCEGMSRHATFENFGMAFLTLFQVSTGDNWNGIMKDTLRDCTHDERSCLSSLQFVSPLYFVSFVLTAQFVLINVVVAVLMKHLDDSNKEAQEDAEMDAELQLEMAHGLGPGPRLPAGSPGAPGRGPGGAGGGGDTEGGLCRRCYSPAQENLWLDSVSLIIKDSLEGELTIIDNLSGSIFHHYSSPAGCKKCHHDKQEVQLAETEAFSLNSDRSSSILLGDDLSLEDPTACPPGPKDSKGELDPPEPMHVGDLGECFFPLSSTAVSPDPENFLCEMEEIPFNPVRSWLKHESSQAPPSPFSPDASSPLLPMPAEFFHPAVSASQKGPEKGTGTGTLPKIALQGSWASLRSPRVNCTLLRQTTGSDTSLDASPSSSAGSLQTTLEDSLTLSDSPRRALGPPALAPGPRAGLSPAARRRLSLRGRGLFSLRGLRAHQRSHSSGGSTSPGCTHHDSMDPSDEEGRGGAGGGGAGSEHSETLSSLSLTSLFCPPPPPPPPGLTPARKFSSTSSLAAPGRPRAAPLAHGLARSPSWAADRSKDPPGRAPMPMGLGPLAPLPQPLPGELEPGDAASKRKR